MKFYGVTPKELDGIVSQLRVTRGVEVAIFLYELEPNVYKVSLRSKEKVDVSKVAKYFGGGGHVKAAAYGDIKLVVCAILSVANLGIASVAHARIVARFL